MTKKILFLLFVVFPVSIFGQQELLWKRADPNQRNLSSKTVVNPNADNEKVFELNTMALQKKLNTIANKNSVKDGIEITFPNANGDLERFSVWESSNFSPELQAKFPEIRAYAGVGITDRNATVNFSWSPSGIQTMVLRAGRNAEFIESYSKNSSLYVVFESKNNDRGLLPLTCKTEDKKLVTSIQKRTGKLQSNNGVFKTFRLALSCTGEYADHFGGTVSGALAGMSATLSRVNGIFNRDLALKLELVANTTDVIYLNAATDPYSDSDSGANGSWNQEVQDVLTAKIGDEGYDMGHLFGASGGGGNAGCIGCICEAPTVSEPLGKGSAFTSPSNNKPEGDTFDIDYVAHEMGHQLGANHSYSFDIEETGVSVEPGSGSTIMGYAGITDYDVQSHSDDYFAYASIRQIQDNLATKSCSTNVTLSNSTPAVSAGGDYQIPKGTPFVLKGTGSDPNGDSLTYCWEQYDTAITTSGGNSIAYPEKPDGPLFRSFKPITSPVRYFPNYNDVLLNKLNTTWESVSSVARTLHFTLTARDNASLGFGQTNSDEMVVTVKGTVGPFEITSQSTGDLSWFEGTNQTITWNVNGTNALPGSANVNIKLSTDGGLTFPTVLAANTPNDGSENITVPNLQEANCRIMIEPTANIYYAINSMPFAIGYSVVTTCNTYSFSAPFAIPEDLIYTTRSVSVPFSKGTVYDVNVAIGVTHQLVSDVQIEMVSPQNTTVKLLENSCPGVVNSVLRLNFDDFGDVVSCSNTATQTVLPFQALSGFNGQNQQGDWILRVRDAYKGDNGTLDSATITICTQDLTLASDAFEINDFVLYPNPNNGTFQIQFTSDSGSGVKVSVHDLAGRLVFANVYENKGQFNETIRLSNPQSGVYLVTVVDGSRKEVMKVVVR